MGYELKCTERVCDTLEVIALSVCEVVHGVCVPFVAGAPVWHVEYAVHDWVAEMHVGAGHVYLGAENHLSGLYVAAVHFAEKTQALLCRTVAVRAVLSGLGGCAFLSGNLLRCLLVDICAVSHYAPLGKVPQLLEIVARIAYLAPLESEPFDILLNGANKFHVLLLGVGIVETQVAYTVIFLCHSKVDGNGLCVANVQVSVRFGRETCLYSASVLALFKVTYNNLLDKADAFLLILLGFVCCSHRCIVFFYSYFYNNLRI